MAIQNDTLKPYSEQARELKEGDLYVHYKGKQYKFISVARHSETLEECVVYQALYGDCAIWVRPLDIFLEKVLIDGELKLRFKKM